MREGGRKREREDYRTTCIKFQLHMTVNGVVDSYCSVDVGGDRCEESAKGANEDRPRQKKHQRDILRH